VPGTRVPVQVRPAAALPATGLWLGHSAAIRPTAAGDSIAILSCLRLEACHVIVNAWKKRALTVHNRS
jgi:hypothetical protein